MTAGELSKIRVYLEKTQQELASLLGVSLKAVQSFEQGWRNIPAHVERQVLFLLSLMASSSLRKKSCWQLRKCTGDRKRRCPAYQFGDGRFCWFVNGTFCRGRTVESWPEKMAQCRQCRVFQADMPVGVFPPRPETP